MIFLALTALVAAQPIDMPPPLTVKAPPFFSAFTAAGTGTFGPCSTTAPTGAKGEALTFTRGSTAMCTKTATGGLATTGIANGDLVSMSSNVARVEYDSNGVLGLLVESSRTNSALRSESFDNAAWLAISGGGPAAPTVTANAAVAPDGTTTAERVDFPAVGASGYSIVRQTGIGSVGSASTRTLFVRAVSSACSVFLADASAGSESVLCAAVVDSWSRCSVNVSAANVLGYFDIGTNRNVTGEGATSSCSVYVWGAQAETTTAAYATSYIPTTSAAVTRSADLGYFALTGAPGFAVGSMAATINPNSAMSYATPVATATSTTPPGSGADQLVLYAGGSSGASYKCYLGNTAATLAVSGTAAFVAPANGPHRGYCAAGGIGGTLTGGFDTNSMSASGAIAAGPYGAENYLFVGSTNNAITYVDSIVSRICRDPSPTRCR